MELVALFGAITKKAPEWSFFLDILNKYFISLPSNISFQQLFHYFDRLKVLLFDQLLLFHKV